MSEESTQICKRVGLKPIALDGGYGWLVVLGSFFIHVFADGFVYSFGVIADPIMEEFEASNAAVGTILALLTGLMMAVGPVSSAICNRFGCRMTTIIGAIIASIGCVVSSFATSVIYLILTAGVVMGIGFGLMYCPAIVIVTVYFEKYRSLATGITVCGAGVGTLVFPKILGFLLDIFDKENAWRRVFQIYSGVILLCVPCAALFKPIKFLPIYEENEDEFEDIESNVLLTKDEDETSPVENSIKNFSCNSKIDYKDSDDVINVETKPLLKIEGSTELFKPMDPLVQRSTSFGVCEESFSSVSKKRLQESESNLVELCQSPKKKDSKSKINLDAGYLNVTDCFFPRSVTNLSEYHKDPQNFRSLTSIAVFSPRRKQNSYKNKFNQDIKTEQELKKDDSFHESDSTNIWRTIKKMMDLSLFSEPVFIIFAVSNFLISIGFDPPPMYMPMYSHHKEWTPSQATTTVSIYGLASICGRVAFGLICDCKFPFSWGKDRARNRMWILSISIILCGISCCFVFWMNHFWVFGMYCFFFAFTISSCVSLSSVVLVDLVGVERLTNAFGLLLFIEGIATFIGPPVSGKLFDVTKQYYWSFTFCGICLALGGDLLIVILGLQRLSLRRANVKEISNHQLIDSVAKELKERKQ